MKHSAVKITKNIYSIFSCKVKEKNIDQCYSNNKGALFNVDISLPPVSMLYSPRKFTTLGLLEKPGKENKKSV